MAESQGVEKAEVVGAILQAFLALPRPVRLKDLEDRTGIPSAKLHRYLVSMIRCGLVQRREGSTRYDLGLLIYRLGQAALHEHDLVSLLAPVLEQSAPELIGAGMGQAVGIGQWMGQGAAIVRWVEGTSPLTVRMRPGALLDITGSATAKLLAAHLPRETTEPIVRQELAGKGKLSEAAVRRVFADYAQIREAGIAHSIGARQSGLNALSAPVVDHTGAVVAAVTVLGMAPAFDADPHGLLARRLVRVARSLSTHLSQQEQVPASRGA
jgi:DNA-binding IclR family transcriptional regulator